MLVRIKLHYNFLLKTKRKGYKLKCKHFVSLLALMKVCSRLLCSHNPSFCNFVSFVLCKNWTIRKKLICKGLKIFECLWLFQVSHLSMTLQLHPFSMGQLHWSQNPVLMFYSCQSAKNIKIRHNKNFLSSILPDILFIKKFGLWLHPRW